MKKILIIEDNLDIINCLKFMLEQERYVVSYINKDFSDSIDIIKKYKPNLILMDIQLSININGLDIAKVIKKEIGTMDIPIIALTCVTEKKEVEQITNFCDAYISKDLLDENLLELIKIYIN